MTTFRILVADDCIIFRDGLKALITSLPAFQLVGEAATGEDLVHLAHDLQPDIILMDIELSGLNRGEAIQHMMYHSPNTKILVMTSREDDLSICMALSAGSLGYILKGATHCEIVQAIQAVAHGQAIFGPSIAARIASYFILIKTHLSTQAFPELSDREREVLQLVVQGYSNTNIARELCIAPKTVSNHLSNIFSKLAVNSRSQAVLKIREVAPISYGA